MPEYTIAEMFEVQDAADDFILDDLAADFAVSEDDFDMEEPLVVSEADTPDVEVFETLPGSDARWEPEQKVEDKKPADWANDGDHTDFIRYIRDKLKKVPRHTGNTIPGCERAVAYLKALDTEISKAMRSDYEGKIDESEIDAIRREISTGIERLENKIKQLRGKKASLDVRLVSTGHCDKCGSTTPLWHNIAENKFVCLHCEAEAKANQEGLTKEATTPVLNVYMSPFERAIVGTLVNSTVSAGHNIEETYEQLKNKYNFTPREELAIQQLVADYGYPVYKDRGRLNESSDPAAGDGVDWSTNYYA